jgi:hypothetical protein
MKRFTTAILAAMIAAALPSAAFAYGAIAVGIPPNVAKDGFAVGVSTNVSTAKGAAAEALKSCRTGEGSKAVATRRCKVVETFHKQCFAFAADTRANKSGIGWGVASNKFGARAKARGACRSSGGFGAACTMLGTECDR